MSLIQPTRTGLQKALASQPAATAAPLVVIAFAAFLSCSFGQATEVFGLGQRVEYRIPGLIATDFRANGLPPGLEVDEATGLISGIPSHTGVYSVEVSAESTNGSVTLQRTMRIAQVLNPWLTSWPEDWPFEALQGEIKDFATSRTLHSWGHHLAVTASGHVIAWGDNNFGQADVPVGLAGVVAVSAGTRHSLALMSEGEVVAWGGNMWNAATVPPGLGPVAGIAAGPYHNLVVTTNGKVVAWGSNDFGESDVPDDLPEVVKVAAGGPHWDTEGPYSLALTIDGRVRAWGDNTYGQTDVPPDLRDVIDIAAGAVHNLALQRDGRLVAWGGNVEPCWGGHVGQIEVPVGLTKVVAIAAGAFHSCALTSDGRVIQWGKGLVGGFCNMADISILSPIENAVGITSTLILVRYVPSTPALRITRSGDGSEIEWSGGIIQFTPTLHGPWTGLPAASPLRLSTIGEKGFFRVKISE